MCRCQAVFCRDYCRETTANVACANIDLIPPQRSIEFKFPIRARRGSGEEASVSFYFLIGTSWAVTARA